MNKISIILEKYGHHPDFIGFQLENINQKGIMDDTVLHIAIRKNLIEDVKCFLENGANPNIPGDLGYTPLQYACMYGHFEIAELLLSYQSNPMILNEFNQSAFDVIKLSKKENKYKMIKLLENYQKSK